MKKKDLLKKTVEHIDIKAINAVKIIEAMKKMSFPRGIWRRLPTFTTGCSKKRNARSF